ncbi:MAG: enoyl-CoA hydratase-related protein [Myxococcota bacterium]
MLEVSREGAVLILRFNSPETKNALTPDTMEELIATLGTTATDNAVKAAILTGAPPVFTSGMQLDVFHDHRSPQARKILHEFVPRMLRGFIDYPKPWIAAVNGPGVGFGATICGLADITLMGASAKLRAPFGALAVVPEAGSTVTFPQLMGYQAAMWTLLGGEWMDAEACVRQGLAVDVFPDDDLMEEAMRRAKVIARGALPAVLATKELLNRERRTQLHAANDAELKRFVELQNQPTFAEAMAAMKERRAPDFAQFETES